MTFPEVTVSDNSPGFLGPTKANRLEGHLGRSAAGPALPGEKQSGVRVGDVLIGEDAESLGGVVDPARGALDLAKVPNWSFIQDDVSGTVAPLGTEFFVAERWLES